jgi:hypothetical protein
MNKEQTTREEMIRNRLDEGWGVQTEMRILGLFKYAQVSGTF